MPRLAQGIAGYLLLLAGVLVGLYGFTALAGRAEGGSSPPWGWPETIVLAISIGAVLAGLVLLTVAARRHVGCRFVRRS
jgi:lysylphosphatidylglycerol synthetase-like protein (DUF2156 family)